MRMDVRVANFLLILLGALLGGVGIFLIVLCGIKSSKECESRWFPAGKGRMWCLAMAVLFGSVAGLLISAVIVLFPDE